jgi:uncharacterized membrane protein
MDNLIFVMTLIAALTCGLMAGLYFAFSVAVMGALQRIRPQEGIAAMQSINAVILNPLFGLAFGGSAVASTVLAASSLFRWDETGAGYLLAGGVLFLIGSVLVTIVVNVPLNNELAAVEPRGVKAEQVWIRYTKRWTAGNHVRTAASLAATVLLIMALH